MSFVIVNSSTHLSYDTPDHLIEDYKRIIKTFNSDQVVELDVSDRGGCLEFLRESFVNLPCIKNSRRVVYFGKQAHFIVYNLALAAEFPDNTL